MPRVRPRDRAHSRRDARVAAEKALASYVGSSREYSSRYGTRHVGTHRNCRRQLAAHIDTSTPSAETYSASLKGTPSSSSRTGRHDVIADDRYEHSDTRSAPALRPGIPRRSRSDGDSYSVCVAGECAGTSSCSENLLSRAMRRTWTPRQGGDLRQLRKLHPYAERTRRFSIPSGRGQKTRTSRARLTAMIANLTGSSPCTRCAEVFEFRSLLGHRLGARSSRLGADVRLYARRNLAAAV